MHRRAASSSERTAFRPLTEAVVCDQRHQGRSHLGRCELAASRNNLRGPPAKKSIRAQHRLRSHWNLVRSIPLLFTVLLLPFGAGGTDDVVVAVLRRGLVLLFMISRCARRLPGFLLLLLCFAACRSTRHLAPQDLPTECRVPRN